MRAPTPPGSRSGRSSSTASSSSCRASSASATPSPTGTATRPSCTGSAWTTSPPSSRRARPTSASSCNTVVFTVATIILKTAIALGLALLLTQGIRRPRVPLPSPHLPAGRPADPRRQPHLPFRPRPRRRASSTRRCGPWASDGLRAALADRRLARDVERHRRRRLARRRLHHGHPHRRPAGHPAGLLRSRRRSTAPPVDRPSGTSRCRS